MADIANKTESWSGHTLGEVESHIKSRLNTDESIVGFYTCGTAAATAAKVVAASNYVLTDGGSIKIKFTYANSVASPTLNINSTGAKAIVYNGAVVSATNTWNAGDVVEFYYDHTYNSNVGAYIGIPTVVAIPAELSQLGQELYFQDGRVIGFKSGYVAGSSIGSPYEIIESSTKHYCILPANSGYDNIIIDGCVSYQRVNIDADGNYLGAESAAAVISNDTKFIAFNFEDADNAYKNVRILQNLSLAEQNRFFSNDYNCFNRYSTYKEQEYSASDGVLYSQFLRSIISIQLNGFNKENPHHLYNLTRNHGTNHKYGIIIRELISGTWTIVFNSSLYNVEAGGVQNGVNKVTWTSGDKSVTAIIDYSFIPNDVDVNLVLPSYVFKQECFESFDELTTQVNTIQENALFKQMLGMSVVSNNLANPAAIQDGKFVSDAGGIGTDENWALISVPVEEGNKYTFGGFYLGRGGYYRFQDANGEKVSNGSYSDPNGTQIPCTITAPTGAVALLFDIKTGSSPENPYTYLTVNLGETLLPYDEYKTAITSIDGKDVAGGATAAMENRISALEDDVTDLQDELLNGIETIIADLPVSDGTDVSIGYAYIDLYTNVVKVKLS